jgi:hypothetical protein
VDLPKLISEPGYASVEGRADLFPARLCCRVDLGTDPGTLGNAEIRSHSALALTAVHPKQSLAVGDRDAIGHFISPGEQHQPPTRTPTEVEN